MAQLTADLGRFVSELRLESIPEQGRAIAKTGFIDCFGVMVAGAREPVVGLVDRTLAGRTRRMAPRSSPRGRRKVADAALVNGVAAHVLDYDDVSLDGHPSAVLVPAILAQAEASGASGAEMLIAYVAGYEVWAELFRREDGHAARQGLASDGGPRGRRRRSSLCQASAPRCRDQRDGNRGGGLDVGRAGVELRDHDEVVPGRPRRPVRRRCGGARGRRLHRLARRDRASGRVSSPRSRRAASPTEMAQRTASAASGTFCTTAST